MHDKIDVSYVANLARLHLQPDEVENYSKQLEEILSYVELLNEVDVSQVPDNLIDLEKIENVLRKDVVRDSFSAQQALSNAPAASDSLFNVLKVVE